MYVASVLALLLLLPVASVGIELSRPHEASLLSSCLHWFVFWGVGIRLLTAGFSQIIRPRYTAETILGLKGEDAQFVVRELGFSNTAMGVVGCLSGVWKSWQIPAAVAGAIFYCLAGANHHIHGKQTSKEVFAMLSDLGFAALLTAMLIASWRARGF